MNQNQMKSVLIQKKIHYHCYVIIQLLAMKVTKNNNVGYVRFYLLKIYKPIN